MRGRWLVAVLVAVLIGWARDSAAAQPAVPGGVFVRDADRNLFLVLDGERHRVPVYPLSPEEVEAIPESGRWIVPSAAGGIEPGDNPHWERHPEVVPGTTAPGLFPARP